MTDPQSANPYVGLRPFFAADSLYFFGRREQSAELLRLLHGNHFLSIVGSSGCGKSSLIRAGLIPALLGGFLVEERDHWRTAVAKPGDAPLRNLARALLAARDGPDSPTEEAIDELVQCIQSDHTAAVVEQIRELVGEDANLLLLVDQFEEVFAFRGTDDDEHHATLTPAQRQVRSRQRAEADDFVDLLIELGRRDLPVYVVLTMRTDFLGDCDLFFGLPEAMNNGRYLVPRLEREQLRQAIEGPALLSGAKLAPRLVDSILNSLGDRSDRLPVLQHALNRTWESWHARGGDGPIDLLDFREVGGLENALSQHAEDALGECNRGDAERVFRCLTDTDMSHRRVRRPAITSEISRATGLDRGRIDEFLECFARPDRNFVVCSEGPTADDDRLDISHESLIRQWDTLRSWVDEEREARDRLAELLRSAVREREGKAGFLQDPELGLAIDRRKTDPDSPAWAARYGVSKDDLRLAHDYLARSQEHAKKVLRGRILRFALAAGSLGAVVLAALLWVTYKSNQNAVFANDLALNVATAQEEGLKVRELLAEAGAPWPIYDSPQGVADFDTETWMDGADLAIERMEKYREFRESIDEDNKVVLSIFDSFLGRERVLERTMVEIAQRDEILREGMPRLRSRLETMAEEGLPLDPWDLEGLLPVAGAENQDFYACSTGAPDGTGALVFRLHLPDDWRSEPKLEALDELTLDQYRRFAELGLEEPRVPELLAREHERAYERWSLFDFKPADPVTGQPARFVSSLRSSAVDMYVGRKLVKTEPLETMEAYDEWFKKWDDLSPRLPDHLAMAEEEQEKEWQELFDSLGGVRRRHEMDVWALQEIQRNTAILGELDQEPKSDEDLQRWVDKAAFVVDTLGVYEKTASEADLSRGVRDQVEKVLGRRAPLAESLKQRRAELARTARLADDTRLLENLLNEDSTDLDVWVREATALLERSKSHGGGLPEPGLSELADRLGANREQLYEQLRAESLGILLPVLILDDELEVLGGSNMRRAEELINERLGIQLDDDYTIIGMASRLAREEELALYLIQEPADKIQAGRGILRIRRALAGDDIDMGERRLVTIAIRGSLQRGLLRGVDQMLNSEDFEVFRSRLLECYRESREPGPRRPTGRSNVELEVLATGVAEEQVEEMRQEIESRLGFLLRPGFGLHVRRDADGRITADIDTPSAHVEFFSRDAAGGRTFVDLIGGSWQEFEAELLATYAVALEEYERGSKRAVYRDR